MGPATCARRPSSRDIIFQTAPAKLGGCLSWRPLSIRSSRQPKCLSSPHAPKNPSNYRPRSRRVLPRSGLRNHAHLRRAHDPVCVRAQRESASAKQERWAGLRRYVSVSLAELCQVRFFARAAAIAAGFAKPIQIGPGWPIGLATVEPRGHPARSAIMLMRTIRPRCRTELCRSFPRTKRTDSRFPYMLGQRRGLGTSSQACALSGARSKVAPDRVL